MPYLELSGVEVLGGISAVIRAIDASCKIYGSARKDKKLPKTFEAVGRRLPIILDTLQTCEKSLIFRTNSMPVDVCEALENVIHGCDEKAGVLRGIFEKVIPGEDDAWERRYIKALQRLSKGNKVEELMISIIEDVQHIVKRILELENIVKEMKSLPPAVLESESSTTTFTNSGSGTQTNIQVLRGGQQYNYANNTGHGHLYNSSGPVNQQFGKDWS